MIIRQKGMVLKGRLVQGVEMIPAGMPVSLRVQLGIFGILSMVAAFYLFNSPSQESNTFREKGIVVLSIFGALGLIFATAKQLYQAYPGQDVQTGLSLFGMTVWIKKVRLSSDLLFEISEDKDQDLFLTLFRPTGESLLGIGPFLSREQALDVLLLLNPRKLIDPEVRTLAKADEKWMISNLEGGRRPAIGRAFVVTMFAVCVLFVLKETSWFVGGVFMVIILVSFVQGMRGIIADCGVFYETNNGESVEAWCRERLFWRLEYRKFLRSMEPPQFLRMRFHLPTMGWIIFFVATECLVIGLIFSNRDSEKVVDEREEVITPEMSEDAMRGIELLKEAVKAREELQKDGSVQE